jgi:hypothetical protein
MQAQTKRGSGAIKWGLIFGLILGVLSGLRAAFALVPGARLFGMARGGEIILALAAFFLAGLLAARQSRSVGAAAVAGAITAIVASVISGAVSLAGFFISPRAYALANGLGLRLREFGHPILLISIIVSLIMALLVYVVIGAGVGALGGLAGRGSRPAAPRMPQDPPTIPTPPQQLASYPTMPGGYAPPPPSPGYPPTGGSAYGSGDVGGSPVSG